MRSVRKNPKKSLNNPCGEAVQAQPTQAKRGRVRVATLGVVVMISALLVGAVGLSDTLTNVGHGLQILALLLFVISMVTLAKGMLGDIQRRS